MALTAIFNPWLIFGTTAELPTTPLQGALVYNTDLKTLQFSAGGIPAVLPSFPSVANIAALKAIPADSRSDGLRVQTTDTGNVWSFDADSTNTGDDILTITPTAGTGRWLRAAGSVDLAVPFTAAAADGAVLLTFPTGSKFHYLNSYWQITVAPTGGTDSAIGVASNKSGFTAAGSLLGGAAGDGSTALTVGAVIPGTIGSAVDSVAKLHTAIFVAGNTVTHERITSVFTTGGTGFVHLVGILSQNLGS